MGEVKSGILDLLLESAFSDRDKLVMSARILQHGLMPFGNPLQTVLDHQSDFLELDQAKAIGRKTLLLPFYFILDAG